MACFLQSAWKMLRHILETKTSKELALITAGALASVFWGLIVQVLVFNIQMVTTVWVAIGILLILLVILIVYGIGASSKIMRGIYKWIRRFYPKVGILEDMGWDLSKKVRICTNTDISPRDWEKEISGFLENKGNKKISVKLINAENGLDRYNAIINPYGGVYPEYDLKNFKTMNKILNYIKHGGLFINVADIPGYFAHNPLIKPEGRTIIPAHENAPYMYLAEEQKEDPPKYLITPIRQLPLFDLTPFTRELGVEVYITERYPIFNWGTLEFVNNFPKTKVSALYATIHRAAVCTPSIEPIIKPKSIILFGMETPVTPLFFVVYGDGKLLSSLIFEKTQDERLRKELKKMLGKLIIDFIDPQPPKE